MFHLLILIYLFYVSFVPDNRISQTMYTILILLALAGAKAANVNRHMKLLDIDNHIQSNGKFSLEGKKYNFIIIT